MIFSSHGPRDDLSESIYRFLLDAVARNNNSTSNLEIEAKVGLLIDKRTNRRIELPVLSECVVNYEGWTYFLSDMPSDLHRKFNEQLNKQFVTATNKSLGWKYIHTKTIDHILPKKLIKTRITQDATSGELLEAQIKQNIGHLAIFQPNCLVDVRLSVNVETKIPIESVKEELMNHPLKCVRKKDRIAYEVAQGLLSLDLTQVTQNNGDGNKIKHEFEVEVKDPEAVLKSPEALKVFVDSIRELCQVIR